MRSRRRIVSNKCYEICFRAESGLPLAALRVIKFLLASILARTQRDEKVILCHDIWNGSHCHMIVVAKDSEAFTRFYGEIQKRITDVIKRLLGKQYLRIWEDRATVMQVADLEMAKERISYLYANPAQDNLVDSIEKFPGYSSWNDFKSAGDELNASSSKFIPWVRLPSIPELPSEYLTSSQDYGLVQLLANRCRKKKHELKRYPNAWMACFGVSDSGEVKKINEQIRQRLRERETLAAEERRKEGKPLMGVKRLSSQPILAEHTPKKKERRIFVLCTYKEMRKRLIREFKHFCDLCKQCYQRWKLGDFSVVWPPGAFKPPIRPAYNLIVD